MDAANMTRDVFTYNALLNCQSKARHLPSSEPASLLASMYRDKVATGLVCKPTCAHPYALPKIPNPQACAAHRL